MGALIDCAGQGEGYEFTNPEEPDECCGELEDVHSTDSISVEDTCYWTGTVSGYPGGVCSNCGNGICEEIESVCGCAEDCAGLGKSTYNTIQQFCNEGYDKYCEGHEDLELELCSIC